MSRIDDLIAELAPEGVRHVALSEVAEYSPTRVDAADLDETSFVGVDNLVSDKGGRVDASYPPNTARLTAYEPGDILLGNIRPYLKKVWLATNAGGCSGDVLAVRIVREHRESLDPAFLYYLLSSDSFFAYNMQHAKGAKMPRGNKSAILNYRIPVPPLEVQREIVKALDAFTELEAALEAELEARRLQYAHYRDTLLTFPEAGGVRRIPMGELAINHDSKRKPVTKGQREPGDIPYYGASGVVDYVKDYIFDGDYLLVSEDGANLLARSTPIAFSVSGKTWINNHAHVLEFPSYTERRFVEIYLNSIDLSPYVSGGAQPKLNQANLNKILVPVPDLEEQERIVGILDRLDALVNSLTEGLPAELHARRQQYEYYRDKLLTFAEVAA